MYCHVHLFLAVQFVICQVTSSLPLDTQVTWILLHVPVNYPHVRHHGLGGFACRDLVSFHYETTEIHVKLRAYEFGFMSLFL